MSYKKITGIFGEFIYSFYESQRMSMRVSQKMGYNSLLAKAGGMYHEIGRIKKEKIMLKRQMI